ncbi:MAG: hypothetical protein CVV47_07880 [Spirochaetae bacterium HGW-Spirochaetae-3]|jgi:multicomponent Na+:H+ antiporter subunit D|nr:MAG: hypothetical protein CVV47_07880 [Spirochaetae bacterium HGW-Spirochaetae-3]
MNDAELALVPIFLPLVGAAMALVAKSLSEGRASRILETSGAVVGLALPWAALAGLLPAVMAGGVSFTVSGWAPAIGIAERFDGLAWLVDALGFAGAGAAYLYSRGNGPKGPVFTAIFLVQTSALAATASTADLFNLFVCLEVLGLSSYVLVASSQKPGAFLAAFSYLTVSSAAMVFFLIGLFGLYRLTGSLSYEGIEAGLSALADGGGATASLSSACIVAAIAIRVAVMPVYGWLPDAHAMAPHAVSAVLSGVLIKTPLFALGRLLGFLPTGHQAMALVGTAGVVTALVAVIVALSQKDAKRLLAYHSISQVGYIVAAWGLGTAEGLNAAYMHALFHALFKGLLFLSVGTVTDAAGNRNVYTLRNATAALRLSGDRRLTVAAAYAVGALSICAIPPFNGFASKNAIAYLFKGGWEYWALFAAGVCTIASFMKLSMIYLPPRRPVAGPDEATAETQIAVAAYRISLSMKTAMLALALLCIATGLFYGKLNGFAATLLGTAPKVGAGTLYGSSELAKTGISLVLGAALFLFAVSKPGKAAAALVRSRPRSYAGLVLAFVSGLAALGARLVLFP